MDCYGRDCSQELSYDDCDCVKRHTPAEARPFLEIAVAPLMKTLEHKLFTLIATKDIPVSKPQHVTIWTSLRYHHYRLLR